jgi:VWFA-related protein
MLRPWILLLSIVSSTSAKVALGQQQGQPGAHTTNDNAQREISTKDSDAGIKVEVNLVLVPVVVKDSSGNPVSGLKKEDFQLLDNGKQQNISTFSAETAETRAVNSAVKAETKPAESQTEKVIGGETGPVVSKSLELPRRFIALVFDDLHMRVAEAMVVHAATEKLFASMAPTDRVAIYSTQGDVRQDYTGDATALRKTLANIVPHSAKGEGHQECPNISYYQAALIQYQRDEEAIAVAQADAIVNECPLNLDPTVQRMWKKETTRRARLSNLWTALSANCYPCRGSGYWSMFLRDLLWEMRCCPPVLT